MSRTYKDSPQHDRRQRHVSVRGVRRKPADVRKLGRALIQLAMEEAAAEAAAQAQRRQDNPHEIANETAEAKRDDR